MKKRYRVVSCPINGNVYFKVQRKGWFVWWTLPGLFSNYSMACSYTEKIEKFERPTYL